MSDTSTMNAPLNQKALTDGIAWHSLPITVIASLHVTDLSEGLTSNEADVRRSILHRNDARFSPGTWVFTGTTHKYIAAILVLGALLTAFFQHWVLCMSVLALLGANEVWSFGERSHAKKACDVLHQSRKWIATVLRDGCLTIVPAPDLVPGDIIQIAKGDTIPADARLFAAEDLVCQELQFGKGRARVFKNVQTVVADASASKRAGMIYMGSLVLSGSGRAIVVATGLHSSIGRIARPQDTGLDFADHPNPTHAH